jgi:hypothetical protein
MRRGYLMVVLIASFFGVGGCRSKALESWNAHNTKVELTGSGDRYSYGGYADSSGGRKTRTRTGSGAPHSAPRAEPWNGTPVYSNVPEGGTSSPSIGR